MLVRTSSGSSSVGHLQLAPHLPACQLRTDFDFALDGTLFPVHSMLVSAASPFLARFFAFLRNKSPAANTASLDRLACEGLPLTPTSLNQFLHFVYRPVEPTFGNMEAAVAALRVARFLEAEAYRQAAERWIAHEVAAPGATRADVLAALAAAAELKLRCLAARCLAAAAARFEGATLGDAADLLPDLALAQAALAALGCTPSPAATPRHPEPSKLLAAQAIDDSPLGRHGPALARIAVGPRTPSPGPEEEEELARRLEAALEHRAWGV